MLLAPHHHPPTPSFANDASYIQPLPLAPGSLRANFCTSFRRLLNTTSSGKSCFNLETRLCSVSKWLPFADLTA